MVLQLQQSLLPCLTLLLLGASADRSTSLAPRFSVWPQPKQFDFDNTSAALLDSSFSFRTQVAGEDSDILQHAFGRYRSYIFGTGSPTSLGAQQPALPVIGHLDVSVASTGVDLALGVDESYELIVDASTGATLHAQTVWGALQGLETFAQLVSEDLVLGGQVQIRDQPRFGWRGLMLDTGRHFMPLDILQQVIDGLAAQKMNVFHWHMMDSQSFPLIVEAYPELSGQGAYRADATYSKEDVASIVAFARQRGVRVVVEIDAPGHAASWGLGYPEIIVPCTNFDTPYFTSHLERIPLDISKDATYDVVEAVYSEVSQSFPDKFVHMGGDEVIFGCWNTSATMLDWMERTGLRTFQEAEAFFMRRTSDFVEKTGRRGMVWQESFINTQTVNASLALPQSTVVHFWTNSSRAVDANLPEALRRGHDVVMSQGWYLDLGKPGLLRRRSTDVWLDFYNDDIVDSEALAAAGIDPEIVAKQVLGGEACMFSETVDPANVISTLFPRSSAAAERLYTALDRIGDTGDIHLPLLKLFSPVTQRLEVFRCVLWRRGIRAGPVAWPSYCPGPQVVSREEIVPVPAWNFAILGLVLATGMVLGGLATSLLRRSSAEAARRAIVLPGSQPNLLATGARDALA